MIARRNGEWLSAMVGDERVLMRIEDGYYIGLNSIGSLIWNRIEKPTEVDHLCQWLVSEFEVTPADCRFQIDNFLNELAALNAITLCVLLP